MGVGRQDSSKLSLYYLSEIITLSQASVQLWMQPVSSRDDPKWVLTQWWITKTLRTTPTGPTYTHYSQVHFTTSKSLTYICSSMCNSAAPYYLDVNSSLCLLTEFRNINVCSNIRHLSHTHTPMHTCVVVYETVSIPVASGVWGNMHGYLLFSLNDQKNGD